MIHQKKFLTISIAEWLGIASIYVFFAIQYWLALWVTSGQLRNVWVETFIDYFFLKSILTLPMWWLTFRYFRQRSLAFKVSLNLLMAPIWILAWFYSYRFIQDLRGASYLTGSGAWWDIYIPGLFYFIQFAIFHIYFYYTVVNQEKSKEKEYRESLHHAELRALTAQIQPHFLFNTLNSISASVPHSMESTREMIAKLADVFRYGLKASESKLISLSDEINFIRNWLELEQYRFGQRLEVSYNIDEEVLQHKIPPMMLQPLIENAIRHGVEKLVIGGLIKLEMRMTKNGIAISIRNPVPVDSFHPTTDTVATGTGLYNTRKRLHYLYNEPLHFVVDANHCVLVEFRIPFQ
ncbi:MAG: histidine kinase [Chitinophagaceae bacterium]|nr:histidine kinase [Chitinophagaceae bacterium]